MNDMTAAIAPKSDQINADDLITGPMTVKIAGVKILATTEQPISMTLDGNVKVYRPCKSMARVMVAAWGADSKAYVGRSLTLYRDPTVKWGGMAVGGIRISHMSDIASEMTLMLTMTKANRAPHKVKPLVMRNATASTKSPRIEDKARAIAATGKNAFIDFYNSDEGKDNRAAIKEILAECQAIAQKADDAAIAEDPFTPNPLTATDPELMAQIEREAKAQSDREAAEHSAWPGPPFPRRTAFG